MQSISVSEGQTCSLNVAASDIKSVAQVDGHFVITMKDGTQTIVSGSSDASSVSFELSGGEIYTAQDMTAMFTMEDADELYDDGISDDGSAATTDAAYQDQQTEDKAQDQTQDGDTPADGQDQAALMDQLAAELADVETAAGDDGSASASSNGTGFNSSFEATEVTTLQDTGALGATELAYGVGALDDARVYSAAALPDLHPDLDVDAEQKVFEDGSVQIMMTASPDSSHGIMSVTITGIPASWTVVGQGTYNAATQTWTFTSPAGQTFYGGPTLIPPANSDVDLHDLKVTITEFDPTTGQSGSTTTTIGVIVDAVADPAHVDGQDTSGLEGTAVALNITGGPGDTDGSEIVQKYVISGVPNGFALNHGTDLGNGSWEVSPADIQNITLSGPAKFYGDVNLTVTIHTAETVTDQDFDLTNNTAQASDTLTVSFIPTADTPTITIDLPHGSDCGCPNNDGLVARVSEDGSINVNFGATHSANASPTETMVITVSGIDLTKLEPGSFTISGQNGAIWTRVAGTPDTNASFTLSLAAGVDYSGALHLVPKADSDVDLTNITVTATTHEASSGTSANADTQHFDLVVDAVADAAHVVAHDVQASVEYTTVEHTTTTTTTTVDSTQAQYVQWLSNLLDKLSDTATDIDAHHVQWFSQLLDKICDGETSIDASRLQWFGNFLNGMFDGQTSIDASRLQWFGEFLDKLFDGEAAVDASRVQWFGNFLNGMFDGQASVDASRLQWFGSFFDKLFDGQQSVDASRFQWFTNLFDKLCDGQTNITSSRLTWFNDFLDNLAHQTAADAPYVAWFKDLLGKLFDGHTSIEAHNLQWFGEFLGNLCDGKTSVDAHNVQWFGEFLNKLTDGHTTVQANNLQWFGEFLSKLTDGQTSIDAPRLEWLSELLEQISTEHESFNAGDIQQWLHDLIDKLTVEHTTTTTTTTTVAEGHASVALDISGGAGDTDGSEIVQKYVISGMPEGFSLNHGTDLGNGSWEISPQDIGNLVLTAPTNFEGDVNLTVTIYTAETVTDKEFNQTNNTAQASDSFTVSFAPTADTPTVTIDLPHGSDCGCPNNDGLVAKVYEDGSINVNFSATHADTASANETLSITVSGIDLTKLEPGSFTISGQNGAVWTRVAGTSDTNASFTITLAAGVDYSGALHFVPKADSDVDLSNITISATAYEPASGTSASAAAAHFDVVVDAVADAPNVHADDTSVQNTGSGAANIVIHSSLNDTDGSEHITHYQIQGVPNGFTFNHGTNLGNGVWQFTPAEINGLTVTPSSANFDGKITMTVYAFNAETPTDKEITTANNTNSSSNNNCDSFTVEWHDGKPVAVNDHFDLTAYAGQDATTLNVLANDTLSTDGGNYISNAHFVNGTAFTLSQYSQYVNDDRYSGPTLTESCLSKNDFQFYVNQVAAHGGTLVGLVAIDSGAYALFNYGDHLEVYTVATNWHVASSLKIEYTLTDADGDSSTAIAQTNTYHSPLVLDLDRDGVELVNRDDGVTFDIDNDGHGEKVGWVGRDDGLLAIDKNHDGVINDQSELFGNNGQFSDGFSNLASYDENGDGVIDAKDSVFNELFVWQDANQNGISDAGELYHLSDLEIASINLNATAVSETVNGNIVTHTGSFTYNDGSTGEIVDAWFSSQEQATVTSDGNGTMSGTDDVADTFVFEAGDNQTEMVQNFNSDEGDVLDISGLLNDFDPLQDAINDFVFSTKTEDGSTVLSVDASGSGNAANATQFAVLQGVSTTVDDLAHKNLLVTV